MKSWQELEREFRRVVAHRGVDRVAEDLPAGRATIYRLISGETSKPSLAIRAGAERVVKNFKESDE